MSTQSQKHFIHVALTFYVIVYITRRIMSFLVSGLIQEGTPKASVGMLASSFSMAYTVGKISAPFVVELISPSRLMGISLIGSGICNVVFSTLDDQMTRVVVWSIHGFLQSLAFPPINQLMSSRFSSSEKGEAWGKITMGAAIGSTVTPLLVSVMTDTVFGLSWRHALRFSGVFSVTVGIWATNEIVTMTSSSEEKSEGSKTGETVLEKMKNLVSEIKENVISNPKLWNIAIVCLFVQLLKTSISEWLIVFLTETGNVSVATARVYSLMVEFGGILGAYLGGMATDRLYSGYRSRVVQSAMGSVVFFGYWIAKKRGEFMIADLVCMLVIGAALNASSTSLSLMASEQSKKPTANVAFTMVFGGLGGSAAGYPIGLLTEKYGWNGTLIGILITTQLVFAAGIPLWNVKNGKDVEKKEK